MLVTERTRGGQIRRELDESPLLQSWYVHLEQGYDHVQSEKTHLLPADRFLNLLHFLSPVCTLCWYKFMLQTLCPSFLSSSTA